MIYFYLNVNDVFTTPRFPSFFSSVLSDNATC